MRPTKEPKAIPKIIICAFYFPPKSKKARELALLSHLTLTYHSLKTIHPTAKVIILGDRKEVSIDKFLGISGNLQQIVDKPTRKGNILDIIVTDMASLH